MVPNTPGNGSGAKGTAKEFKSGKTVQGATLPHNIIGTRELGWKTKLTGTESCITQMEIFMKGSGRTTRPMGEESIHIQMELLMRGTGRVISRMGMA